MIERLEPRIQNYAWGSHTVLAALTGRNGPTVAPEAELWMGAHEAAPAGIAGSTLDRVIAADPVGVLGAACAQRFGGRLPFLLKVLAPERALSIQCHPNAQQAIDAPSGTYGDRWPKPEALIAVTDYEIFVGLRPYAETAAFLRSLNLSRMDAVLAHCDVAPQPAQALLASLLQTSDDARATLVAEVVDAIGEHSDTDTTVAAVLRIAQQFPGDIGLVVLLTMVHRILRPGDYVFLPAGVLHAYVRGTCVEILANSDNIVRAGLTPKAINIEELLRIVDVDQAMVPQQGTGDRVHSFPAQTQHFQLHVVGGGAGPVALPGAGAPRIALALDDEVTVSSAEGSVVLAPGQSCFLDAGADGVTATGPGRLYLAAVPAEVVTV
ncbi:mannose-6-phosphate isomerase, class I [Rudaeicoccus suwonensis]|uniref:mannose-6-phosphate isomerase n=1 Tax=Rudaeicoccus suwonensis TaxID=657409 RepID=A0A561DVA8_9MICO|nr:mannose-6-phosphate isomerase, class I [Rudaeicoccus suwonensis]TWE07299.1 mannose-6-phosphate isomerase type 1 [Rudaeicoccus suwonensis]